MQGYTLGSIKPGKPPGLCRQPRGIAFPRSRHVTLECWVDQVRVSITPHFAAIGVTQGSRTEWAFIPAWLTRAREPYTCGQREPLFTYTLSVRWRVKERHGEEDSRTGATRER